MPVTLTGHINVPFDRLDAVTAALQEHIRLTRAEPGCLSFDVTPHANIAGRFEVKEMFVDQEAFDHHQARAQASPWAETTRGIERHYTVTL